MFIRTDSDCLVNLHTVHMITWDENQIFFRFGGWDSREWISKKYNPENYQLLIDWLESFEIGKPKDS